MRMISVVGPNSNSGAAPVLKHTNHRPLCAACPCTARRQLHVHSARVSWRRQCFRSSVHASFDSEETRHQYEKLLQKARHWTLDAPEGQLLGRAGRRSILEDGERALLTCISMHSEALSPRILLMTNLILQNRGREREVPLMAIEALRKTRLQKCRDGCVVEDVDSSIHVVELGLRALKKAGREHSMRHFVEDAIAAMPALRGQFDHVAAIRFRVDMHASQTSSRPNFPDFLTSEDEV